MLRLFRLALLGVATIGNCSVVGCPIVRSLSCFRCLVLRYGLSGISFPGLMVTTNVTTLVLMLACLALQGLLPYYSGLVIEDGCIPYSSLDKEDI
jgi:hypothetical protein